MLAQKPADLAPILLAIREYQPCTLDATPAGFRLFKGAACPMKASLTAIARHWPAMRRNSNDTDSSVAMAAFAAQSEALRLHSWAFISSIRYDQ